MNSRLSLLFLLIIISCAFSSNFIYSQTYRLAFDRFDAQTDNVSFSSNIGGVLNHTESYTLCSYILMWKATQDKKYLNKFILHSKRIQDHRDDKIANNLYGVHGSDCSNGVIDANLYAYSHYPIPAWSTDGANYADHTCGSDWSARILHSGNIIYPMAEFIYLMLNDPETNVSLLPDEINIGSVVTYLDYAFWLKDRVEETMRFHHFRNWDCGAVTYRDNWHIGANCSNMSTNEPVNMLCAMAKAHVMMYQVEMSQFNTDYDAQIVEICSNHATNIASTVRNELSVTNSNYHAWYHDYDHTWWDDIAGHAALIMEFADLCYTYQMPNFYHPNLQLFDLNDMQKFGRSFAEHIYKSPLSFYSAVNGTNNSWSGAGAQTLHSGLYVLLSKYNPYVYQQISDYFSYQATNNSGSLLYGYAALAYYEGWIGSNGLPKNIFNPLIVIKDVVQWRSCSSGDFDGDGSDEILRVHAGLMVERVNSDRSLSLYAGHPSSTTDHHDGLTVGKFGVSSNNLIASITKSNGIIYIYSVQLGSIQEVAQSSYLSGHLITEVTSGDFDSATPGEEIAVYSKTDGRIYLFTFDGTNINPITINNNFLNYDVVGITAGNFTGSSAIQIAEVNNSNGHIQVFEIQGSNLQLVMENTTSAGTTNIWNGIAAGDMDGDGLDEIIAHRNLDGQFLIYKVKANQLVNEYGEYFPIDQGQELFCCAHVKELPYNDVLLTLRNFDSQTTIFNFNGICQGLNLDNITINETTSVDNAHVSPAVINTYPIDYHSPNTITAGNNFIVSSSGGRCNFVSGKNVVLTDGFNAETGSEFMASIDGINFNCGNHEVFRYKSTQRERESGTNTVNHRSILVSPNPNNGIFTIEISPLNSQTDVEIHDITGRVVWSKHNVEEGILSINITDIIGGTYILKITCNGFAKTEKIIKL